MSTPFYDLASLVVVPSGYKASKVYAQKPLTTDGQLTFSRASTATRVNSSGLIETVSSNVPRLDYLGSTCPKLLLEPQRLNYATNSSFSDFSGADVNRSTVTKNGISGEAYTDAGGGNPRIFKITTFSTTGYRCMSFYVDVNSVNVSLDIRLGVGGNASTGLGVVFTKSTLSLGAITVYGNVTSGTQFASLTQLSGNIYRITLGGNFTTTVDAFPVFYFGAGATATWLGGLQIENASYPTSLIPTSGATVTRLADAASKTGISSLIGQTEGTLYAEVNLPAANDSGRVLAAIGGNNRFGMTLSGSSAGFFIVTGGGGVVYSSIAAVTGPNFKMALAYKSGSSILYVNGVSVLSTSATFSFDASVTDLIVGQFELALGTGQNGQRQAQALLFKTRLTNAQLAELTSL